MAEAKDTIKLNAYTTNGYPAPNRCETCDASLPDPEARRKHMEETSHRQCPLCNGYVCLGGFHTHASIRHESEAWNDHQVAFTDRQDLRTAQPWAVPEEFKGRDC